MFWKFEEIERNMTKAYNILGRLFPKSRAGSLRYWKSA
jgi:hypothetical protein